MLRLFKNKYKIFFRLYTVAFLVLLVFNLQNNLLKVSAQNGRIGLSAGHLGFGNVFPGEIIDRAFTVFYTDASLQVAKYHIVQKIKPLPGAVVPDGYIGSINQYCEENPTNYALCYRNLCPYLSKTSNEGEGDTETAATVGPEDAADAWTIGLKVPGIIGQISQDHDGGIINVAGDYGCDISVEAEDLPLTGSGFFSANIINDGGGSGGSTGPILASSQSAGQTQILGEAGAPILTIVKTIKDKLLNPGGETAYEITVTNSGNLTAFNVVVKDTLPDGFSFSDGGGSIKTWPLGNIAAGESKKFSYSVRISPDIKAGVYANLAEVSADNYPKTSAQADLEIKKIAVLGAELSDTGFSMNEFLAMAGLGSFFLMLAWLIRVKFINKN